MSANCGCVFLGGGGQPWVRITHLDIHNKTTNNRSSREKYFDRRIPAIFPFAMSAYTCLSCHVAFENFEGQREHFQSDWHRYNLMRKVSGLPPVTREAFNDRVGQMKLIQENTEVIIHSFIWVLMWLIHSIIIITIFIIMGFHSVTGISEKYN